MRTSLAFLLLLSVIACKKNTSMSVEVTGNWKASEMLNPPGLHTGVFVPVPDSAGYFAEFSYGGIFNGHYYFLDGWDHYRLWPEIHTATLYRNERSDSIRIGYDLNATNDLLILTFPSYEESKLKLVR